MQSRKGSSLKTWCGSSVGLEYRPVTPGVASSSLVRTAEMAFRSLDLDAISCYVTSSLDKNLDPEAAGGGFLHYGLGLLADTVKDGRILDG